MRPTIPRQMYDYLIDHWIISAIALTIPAYWFTFLSVAGKSTNLIDTNGNLTSMGHSITWPLFALSLSFALLKTAADKYDEIAKTRGGFILQRLLDSVNAVTSKKMRRFAEFIVNHDGNEEVTAFHDITKPQFQVASLLDNIQVSLSEIFGLTRDQIGLSILYRCDEEKGWHFLESVNTLHDLDLDSLLNNPNTTARQIIDRKSASVFYSDKRVAEQNHQYVPGPRDADFDMIGSVLCRDIGINNDEGDRYVEAVLSITTYGKYLCEPKDKEAEKKILNIIVPTFESRLRLELALLYIRDELQTKCASCRPVMQ